MASFGGMRGARVALEKGHVRRKYKNIPTVGRDGRTYASKLEASHAAALELQKRQGLIRGWLPQVSLPIPGLNRRLVVDFLVVDNEGRVRLQDTKGMKPTRDWSIKRELIEQALGIPVDIISRTRR